MRSPLLMVALLGSLALVPAADSSFGSPSERELVAESASVRCAPFTLPRYRVTRLRRSHFSCRGARRLLGRWIARGSFPISRRRGAWTCPPGRAPRGYSLLCRRYRASGGFWFAGYYRS